MRNHIDPLLEEKMDEAVTHYINSHQASDQVHVDATALALSVHDEGGGRIVTVMPQNFTSQMCRSVTVNEQIGDGPWGEEILDAEGRLAALVAAHIAQQARATHHTQHVLHKSSTGRHDVDTSVMIDAPMRLFNGQSLEHQTDTLVVDVPQLQTLPSLQDMKRCSDADWFHDKSKVTLKDTTPILQDTNASVLELATTASIQCKQHSKKSLPHKKRISKKLKRNIGGSTSQQQELVVINCNEEVQQEEILPDNFVTSVQHSEHIPDDAHHITHEVRPVLICQICGDYYGEEQLKFYQHLKQHYEPHTLIIENPDLAIDKMTNTCIVDNVVPTIPDSIVELSLENTVPKTMYQSSNIEKHILYTSSDKTLNFNNDKIHYSLAGVEKIKHMPHAMPEKADLYDDLEKLELYNCVPCNKTFRKQKQYETHMKEAHNNDKICDMSEFSEPEDLMEGIHVCVEESETGEQFNTLLPHLTVENGQVHQHHGKQWYMRNSKSGGDNSNLAPCGEDDFCDVCPPSRDQQTSPSHLKEEALQRLFDTEVQTTEESHPHFEESLIQDSENPPPGTEVTKTAKDRKKKPKEFKCVTCDRVFNHRNSLIYHMLSHEQKQQACKECGKCFYTTGALKVHLRVHNGDKPYRCDECGREFRQGSDLKYHKISLHSNQKAYKCEYCGKEFARKYSYSLHKKIHTGEKNYPCDYCAKTFRASSYRLAHMRTHTGDRPYKCSECEKCFRVAGDLRRHSLTHEKGRARQACKNIEIKDIKTETQIKDIKSEKITTTQNSNPELEITERELSPKSVALKRIATASTTRQNIFRAADRKENNKNKRNKNINSASVTPNVTITQKCSVKIDEFRDTNGVDPVERQSFAKLREYIEANYHNGKPIQNTRHDSREEPKANESRNDATQKAVYKNEDTDKIAVYTREERTLSHQHFSVNELRHTLEKDINRDIRNDVLQSETIESGLFEKLSALTIYHLYDKTIEG